MKTCQELFGKENIDAVQKGLGGGEIEAESKPLDRMKDLMVEKARGWKAEGDDLTRAWYDMCRLEAADNNGQSWVTGQVKWSVLAMDSVAAKDSAQEWRKASDDVYVQSLKRASGVAAVLPCRIEGADPAQRSGLPLEISVLDQGLGGDREALLGKLLGSLVQDTQKRLGCVQPVSVPADLRP
ncbi:hypothetical protein [Streptomyces sp. NPDC006551]|uniref:hypothetical protein n=1 Tax=Streptomyces sp. NPDC006551 TaxID=3157178 RepID=UPI0033B4649A